MNNRSCRNCRWFAQWPDFKTYAFDAEGVCTAPRPKLGPQPQREVHGSSGKDCPMFDHKKPLQHDDNAALYQQAIALQMDELKKMVSEKDDKA